VLSVHSYRLFDIAGISCRLGSRESSLGLQLPDY